MKIEKALMLKKGDLVRFPPEHKDIVHGGVVINVASGVLVNHQGEAYLWVLVEQADPYASPWVKRSLWPSNRLS